MNWFEKIKRYYDKGLYTNEQVKVFVVGGKITEEQYKEITGEDYNAQVEVMTLSLEPLETEEVVAPKTRTRKKATKKSE